ncbi:MAG: DinB family protein [Acidobacteriia bacterium]|nr:DinB family protein [Terriglobia bacterium]
MSIIDSMLMEFDQESKTTQKLLDRLPEDKLSWKPHAKSQSLGVLAMHIANAPAQIAAAAAQDTFEFTGGGTPEPTTRKEILDAFTQNLAKARDTLKTMDDARIMASWSATSKGKTLMTIPRVALIRGILLNHVYHHRGQLSVYLRLLDVPVPSIYGPSADENPFA